MILLILRQRRNASRLSICLSVCRQNAKYAIFSKTKQFRAMVSVDDLHGLLKEPIVGPLKFKTAEIRHLENRKSPYLNENHQF